MRIIFGGLLVSVLLSPPAAGPSDIQSGAYCITYELCLRTETVNKALTGVKENPQLMKIDELMGVIDEKNRSLKNLLKEKARVIDKIQTALDFRAYAKTPFNKEQLDTFSNFTGLYSQEASALQCALQKLDNEKGLMAAKKELLRNEANYNAIIDELTAFSDNLSDAIGYLRGIIDFSSSTLQVL